MIRSLGDALFPKPRVNSGDRHHLLGGALEKYHMLVGRPGMKGRHDAIGGVERDFVEPLPFVAQMIGIETRLHRQCHECTFHGVAVDLPLRSEEHTSELQSLMRISYAV